VSEAFEKALAAHRAGDFAAAERGYRALSQYRNALQNLAALLNETGRVAEAEEALRRLLGQYPEYAPARYSLAMYLLTQRRYAEAWPLYEARREVLGIADPVTGCPEWRGEPLAGRRLVVVAEQGAGDQMMLGRYLPELAARGADLTVACSPALCGLFEAAGWRTAPYARRSDRLPDADGWSFFGSLPWRLRAQAPPPAVHLPDFGAHGGGGVGVVARGAAIHRHDRHRSLPDGAARELLSLGRDLSPEATGAADFRDTARIVAGLDLVVAVDTSVVHLAGSMGKPCWVLLPQLGLDFRWNGGVASDWYPELRLFRQSTPGAWGHVLDEVRAALTSR
jgi:hypothetical protein